MFQRKISISLFLGIITFHLLFAQNIKYEVLTLRKEQFSMPNRKFYIQKIICDFNQPKYFVTRKGIFNKQKTIILGDSIQKVMIAFLKPSNTYRGGLVPVLMKIKELKIREERHFLKEEGTAKLSVEFYIETDTKPVKIFQSNAFRTYTGLMNITNQHDENVRTIIKSCMIDFNNAKIDFSKYVIPNKIFKAKRPS
ncbi:hypothetical protein LV89_00070 [Arcicella aurantiaca]|uniref:Uncharacterized protein n=1 Tax=Arcicella aurantiaca TaxID=591202 RepID=A0A316EHJ5_9BACT|nr:hypothetical protein [Arcicella aurantiaca]PWK29231.1 hypothetical protein LV89_00070 [Arcicella aurantiaca]